MAATKQKADTVSATIDRIDVLQAKILKALRGIEKRLSALEAERGVS